MPRLTPHVRFALDVISKGGNPRTLNAWNFLRTAEGAGAEFTLPNPKPLNGGQMYSSATALNINPPANTPLQDNMHTAAKTKHNSSSQPAVSQDLPGVLANMLFLSRAGLDGMVKIRLPQPAVGNTTRETGQRTNDNVFKAPVTSARDRLGNPMDQCYLAKSAAPTPRITTLASACQTTDHFVACKPIPTSAITDSPQSGRLKALLSPHYQPTYNNLVAALKLELTNHNDLIYISKFIATQGNIEPAVIEALRSKHEPGTLIRERFDRYLAKGSIQLAYEAKRDPQLKKLKELLGGNPSEHSLAKALKITLITEDALNYAQDTLASPAWRATVQSFKDNPTCAQYIDKLEAYVEEGTCHANDLIMANRRNSLATRDSVTDITAGNTTVVKFPSFNTWDSGHTSKTNTPAAQLSELRAVPNVTRKTLNALPVGRSEMDSKGNYSLLFDKAEVVAFMQYRIPMAKLANYILRMASDQGHVTTAYVNSVDESDGCIRLNFKDQPAAPERLVSCEFVHRSDLWRHSGQELALRLAQ